MKLLHRIFGIIGNRVNISLFIFVFSLNFLLGYMAYGNYCAVRILTANQTPLFTAVYTPATPVNPLVHRAVYNLQIKPASAYFRQAMNQYTAPVAHTHKLTVYEKQIKYIQTTNSKISRATAKRIVLAAHKEEKRTGVPATLILAMAKKESAFNPRALSKVGARGLIQVMPKYHKERMKKMGIKDLYAVEDNIRVGTDILLDFQRMSKGNLRVALHRYSGGARGYANSIMRNQQELTSL